MIKKKIIIGCDHEGFQAKNKVLKILKTLKYSYLDIGCFDETSVDYPDIAKKVCKKITKNKIGILICGSGTGMSICANKYKNIRAVMSYDKYSAKMGRLDNDCNLLCLRGRFFSSFKYEIIIKTFLETEFSNLKRHKLRLNKIKTIK